MRFGFDFQGARRAGYSSTDILDYLRGQDGLDFDVDGARKAGYSDDEIVDYLSSLVPSKEALSAAARQRGLEIERDARSADPIDRPRFTFGYVAGSPKAEKSWGEHAGNLGGAVVSGLGSTISSVGAMVPFTSANNPLVRAGKFIRDIGEGLKTEDVKEREAEIQREADAADSVLEGIKISFLRSVSDPELLANFVASQLPMLIPQLGVARGINWLGKARGLSPAATRSAAVGGAVGTAGVLQGGDVVSSAYDDLLSQPQELWDRNPEYRKLVESGMSPERAKDIVATSLAREAGAAATALSIGLNMLPGGRTIERALAGVKGKGSRLLGAVKGGIAESLVEAGEEGGGQALANLAVREVDPERPITQGVGSQAGMAAAGALVLGGAGGAIGRGAQAQQEKKDTEPLRADEVLGRAEEEQAAQPTPQPSPAPSGVVLDPVSGAPLADWEGILAAAKSRPEIYATIEQAIGENQQLSEQEKADAKSALKEMVADPKAIWEAHTRRPELYRVIAKAAEDTARLERLRPSGRVPPPSPPPSGGTTVGTAEPTSPTTTPTPTPTPTVEQPAQPSPPEAQAVPEGTASTYQTTQPSPPEVQAAPEGAVSTDPRQSVAAAFEAAERAAQKKREREIARMAAQASEQRQDEALAMELGRAEWAGSGLRSEVPPTAMEAAFANARLFGKDPREASNWALQLAAKSENPQARAVAQAELERRREELRDRTRFEGEGGPVRSGPLYSRQEAYQRLFSVIRQRSPRVAATMEMVPEELAPAALKRAARFFSRAFGRQVVFVSADANEFNGAMLPDDPGTVYVNVNSKVSWRRVLGHEMLHTLRRTNGAIYDRLVSEILPAMRASARSRYDRLYGDYGEDIRQEEMTADIFGDMMDDPRFWFDVFRATERSKVKAFFRSLMMALDIMRMRLRLAAKMEGYETRDFIRDIEAVRKAAAKAYADWQREIEDAAQRERAGAEEASATLLASRSRKGVGDFREFVEGLPKDKKGLIVGSGGRTPSEVWALVRSLEAEARKGEQSRDWYRESARAILKAFGGHKPSAERFIQILAITSARSDVKGNFTHAEKALMQYARGEPIHVGIKDIDDKLNDLLYFGRNWEGRKTNNFYVTMMHEIGGEAPAEAVIDMYPARRISGRLNPSDAEYTFADKVYKLVAARLGWPLHEVQAAAWVTQKANDLLQIYERRGWHKDKSLAAKRRIALAQAAIHYGDLVKSRWGLRRPEVRFEPLEKVSAQGKNLTAEIKPSTKLEIGSVIARLSMTRLQEYQRGAFAHVFGDKGPAAFFEAFGLNRTQYRVVEGAGVYDEMMAPNIVATLNVDADLVERIAKAWMYVFRQDAVPFFRADRSLRKDASAAQGVKIVFKERLTNQKLRRVYDALRSEVHPGLGFTRTGANEITVINFRDENGKPFLMDDAAFLRLVQGAVRRGALGVEVQSHGRFGAETRYPEHDWKADHRGTGLLDAAVAGGRPDLRERLDRWADLFGQYAERYARAQRAERDGGEQPRFSRTEPRQTTGPPQRDVAAPIPVDRLGGRELQRDIYGRFGELEDGVDTTERLKIYDLSPLTANPRKTEQLLADLGFSVEYFSFEENPEKGVKWRVPDLKRRGYRQGTLWIYDPRNAHGSFMDVEYTRQWRFVHEAGHALGERFMEEKYGPSKREGRLGREGIAYRGKPPKTITITTRPLTLKEAQRAVEWEDVAFRVQRMLMERLGVKLTQEDFAREYNTNIADALYRITTGDFGDPGLYGFTPSSRLPDLRSVLRALERTEQELARAQGREPTEGVDLASWRAVSDEQLRSAIERRLKGEPLFSRAPGQETALRRRKADFLYDVLDENGEVILRAAPYEQARATNFYRLLERGTLRKVGEAPLDSTALYSLPYKRRLSDALSLRMRARSTRERIEAENRLIPVIAPHGFGKQTPLHELPLFLDRLKRKNGERAFAKGPFIGTLSTLYKKPNAEHSSATPDRTVVPMSIIENIDDHLIDPLAVYEREGGRIAIVIGKLPTGEAILVGIDRVKSPQGDHNFITTIGPKNAKTIDLWDRLGLALYRKEKPPVLPRPSDEGPGAQRAPNDAADKRDARKAPEESVSQTREAVNVDERAHQAATSPRNDLPEPTEAQKRAGNYQKGHVRVAGMPITIENPAGSKRRPEWPVLPAHYGYIRLTEDATGEQVDVFLKPGTEGNYEGPVVVFDTNRPGTGRFDEYKVMIGWDNAREAFRVLRSAYTKDVRDKLVRSARVFKTVAEFKRWLQEGDTKKPAADQPNRSKEPVVFSRSRPRITWATRPRNGEWVSATADGRYTMVPENGGWWAVVDGEPIRWFVYRTDAIDALNDQLLEDIAEEKISDPNEALDVTRRYKPERVKDVVAGWRALAKSKLIFRLPTSSSEKFEDVIKDIDPQGKVFDSVSVAQRAGPEVVYAITFKQYGSTAFLFADFAEGTAYLDASDLTKGSQDGTYLYAAATAWARNNDMKLVPDPRGLSRVNTYRRTEHMLSAALKYDDTKMLSPHEDQGLFGWDDDPSSKEDHDKNIAIMALVSMENTFSKVPEAKNWTYNFSKRRFEDANGDAVTLADFEKLASDSMARAWGIGRTTIARAVFTHTLLGGPPRYGTEEAEAHRKFLSGELPPSLLLADKDQPLSLYSRPQGPSAGRRMAAKVGKAVITATAPVRGALDIANAAAEGVAMIPGKLLQPATSRLYDRVTRGFASWFSRGEIRQHIAHGMASDYGLPEPYVDARDDREIAIQKHIRKSKHLVDRLGSLTPAETRVAYQWMQEKPDTQEEQRLLAMLPEESRQTLAEMKKLISDLGKEAVRLGLMSEETYQRNNMAYLHRTYERHVKNDPAVVARSTTSKAIRAESFRGRGIRDDVAAERLPGVKKGDLYVRLELRDPAPAGSLGKLRRVVYLPAGKPIPAMYQNWRNDGVWEARFGKFDGKSEVGMWRDFTKEEREHMGEIEEVRYAFALTMISLVHDVETARFLQWVAENYAVENADEVAARGGRVAEAVDSVTTLKTYAEDEWVEVPSTLAQGTRIPKYGALRGKYIPGRIWNDIRVTINFRSSSAVMRLYDELVTAWKVAKTALSPAVHTNNTMTNFVMADLEDLRLKHLARALEVMLDAQAGNEEAQALVERYYDSGAELGTHVIQELRRDVIKPVLDKIRGEQDETLAQLSLIQALGIAARGNVRQAWAAIAAKKPMKIAAKPFTILMEAYRLEDSVFRFALWLREVEAGASDKAAGKAARKAFLDYRINAPWIQALRRGPLPFLAFTYRAVPRLADGFAKKPWKLLKYMMVGYAVNSLAYAMLGLGSDDEDRERALLPEEKSGTTILGVPRLIRMPWNDEHGSPVFLDIRRWMPGSDIFDVSGSQGAIPTPAWLSFGGYWALAVELASNKSQFTGKEIWKESDTMGERVAKVVDHVFKFAMPNLPIPNPVGYAADLAVVERGLLQTYSWRNIKSAATGETDDFGREHSLPQAIASSVGVKLASYPEDQLRRNLIAKRDAELRDNSETTSRYRREYRRGAMTEEEFAKLMAKQNEKAIEIRRRYAEKLGLEHARP